LIEAFTAALAARCEQNMIAIGVPIHHSFERPLPGEAGGDAAGGGDRIFRIIAVVIGGKGDGLAVGGEFGEHLDAWGRADMGGLPACPGHDPKIVGVAEYVCVAETSG